MCLMAKEGCLASLIDILNSCNELVKKIDAKPFSIRIVGSDSANTKISSKHKMLFAPWFTLLRHGSQNGHIFEITPILERLSRYSYKIKSFEQTERCILQSSFYRLVDS